MAGESSILVGIIADVQFADRDDNVKSADCTYSYRRSLDRLRAALRAFNEHRVAVAVLTVSPCAQFASPVASGGHCVVMHHCWRVVLTVPLSACLPDSHGLTPSDCVWRELRVTASSLHLTASHCTAPCLITTDRVCCVSVLPQPRGHHPR